MRRCSPSLPTVRRSRVRALALALGASQRTVQRALDRLAAAGKAQSFGRGRARRWMTPPVSGFTTTLLLPAPLPE
jgi:DNA-binding transcriptional MocR family regulator